MRRILLSLSALLLCASTAPAQGLLIPKDATLPPCTMVSHDVKVTMDDQVAVTPVEQTFRNHTDRALEATYIFPGAQGRQRSQVFHVGQRQGRKRRTARSGQGRQIYTDIVRRT